MFPSSGLIQESLVELLGRNAFLNCYLGHLYMPNWTQIVSKQILVTRLSGPKEQKEFTSRTNTSSSSVTLITIVLIQALLKVPPRTIILFVYVLFEQPAVILTEVPASHCLVDLHSDLLKLSHQGWLHILVNEPGAELFRVKVHNFSRPYKCTYILDHPHPCQQTRMLSQGFVEACCRCQRACLRKSWCSPWSPCTYF